MKKFTFILFSLILTNLSYAQNVGISTADPKAKLEIKGDANTDTLFQVKDDLDDRKLTILNNGNVGIGTNGPIAKLTIEDTESVSQTIFTQGLNHAGLLLNMNYTDGAYTPGLFWATRNNNNTKPKAGIYLRETGSGTNMLFGTSNDYTTGITNSAITIDPSGNVGIKTTPGAALHILGSSQNTLAVESPIYPEITFRQNGTIRSYDAIATSAGGYISTSGLNDRIYRTEGTNHIFGSSGSEIMRITPSGRVGIGYGAEPPCPLYVNTTVNHPYTGNYSYIIPTSYLTGGNGVWGYVYGAYLNNTPLNVSIWANGRILAHEFDAISDERVKHLVATRDSKDALEIINQLKIQRYNYIDFLKNGTKEQEGFFAQQVAEIYPLAVSKQKDFIPNIFSVSEYIKMNNSNNTVQIALNKPHGLEQGNKVKLIVDTDASEHIVSKVLNEFAFEVSNWSKETSVVFVYGKEVDDFHTVDYDRIHTLGIAAIQELSKRHNQQAEQIKDLENKMKSEVEILKTDIEYIKESVYQSSKK